jgi:hypothetical protein
MKRMNTEAKKLRKRKIHTIEEESLYLCPRIYGTKGIY